MSLDCNADLLKERSVGNATIIIFLIAGLLEDGDDFVLLEAFTKRAENVLQFSVHDGAVLSLVVKLKDFYEVLEGTGILVLLNGGEDWEEIVHLDLLGVASDGKAHLFNDGIGGVKVQGSEEIWLVAGIDLAFALGVENGEGKLYPFLVTSTDIPHCELFVKHTTNTE